MVRNNQVRIIAGHWRGRRLLFPTVAGLRPTPDRVRETLFAWLTPVLPGSRCLDLFAGSGALGIEALSRGAARVVFIERERAAAHALENNLALLQADGFQLIQTDALRWLQGTAQPFDIVFLDPPFDQNLLQPVCRQLATGGWLASGARIYLESQREQVVTVPETWTMLREKTAGQVSYRLYQVATDAFAA